MSDLIEKYNSFKNLVRKSLKYNDLSDIDKVLDHFEKEIEKESDKHKMVAGKAHSGHEEEIKYSALFENSLTAIALTNKDGKILNCNKALLQLLGYGSADELKIKSSGDTYLSPAERHDVFSLLNKNGGVVEREIQLKKKSGEIIDVVLHTRYLESSNNEILVDNIIDITARKEALRNLSENQRYLNTIFNSINSGVYIVDPATKEILEINDFALKLLKYKREDLLGKRCSRLICNSDKLNCASENLPNCILQNERTLIDSKGNEIEVLKSVKEIQLQGKTYLLETFTDISELKMNEEKVAEREEILQATLEATDDAILVLDEEDKIINSNNQFFDMWRIDNKNFTSLTPFDAVKKSFKELLNPFDSYKNIAKTIKTDKKLLDVLFFKDGRVFERYSSPIYNNGKRAGRVWRFKNITPQALAESKLKELNEELESRINERTIELRISESRLKEAQEIAHLGHWLFDLRSYRIKGSENVYQLLGFKDFKGEKALSEFLEMVHPDDVADLTSKFRKALKNKAVFNTVHRVIKPDGNIIFLRQKSKTFYSGEGNPIYSLGISQDITEQKLASDAILEHERQLEMAMEGTGLGLWDWNMLTNRITINRKFIEVIGYEGVIIGNTIAFDLLVSILHYDDYDRILTAFLHYTQSDSKTFEEEFRLKRSNGEYIWVHARAKVFDWIKDKPSRSIGTFLDITERLEAQLEMQKSEEKFRKLTELSPSPICIQSYNRLLFVNPAWVEAIGYSEKQALKMSFVDLVHPDDKKLAARYSKLRLFGNSAPRRYEIKMLTKQKQTKWFDISVTVINYEDQKASLAVLNDISNIKETENALRESEEKFKSLFFGNNSVMMLLDVENQKIIDANEAACKFYQYSANVIKSMHLSEITLHNAAELKKSLKSAISGKQNLFISKHRLFNGEIRDVEVYSGKVKYGGKDVIYTIIHDITDRKIAEEKIRKSQKELKKLNAQKDKFFSIISHDLKGPIGNFMNFADLLKNHKELLTNESAESIIEHSYNLANNTYKLLENLLIWSKSQLGGIQINQQMIPLVSMLNETISLLKESAFSKNIEIINDVNKTVLVFADRDTILTVLRNLISNAIKFTPKGGKIVCSTGRCKKNKADEDSIKITIADTGIGIPEDKVNDLFTLGKEFSTFGTDNEKGTGLGLILCKELVELNGGKIWAESEKNAGSTFIFSLKCTPSY